MNVVIYIYIYILVYVDDLLLISTSVPLREEHRKKLKQRFQMSQKVDNKPNELLGMRLKIEPEMIEIDQSRYALEVYNSYRDQRSSLNYFSNSQKVHVAQLDSAHDF